MSPLLGVCCTGMLDLWFLYDLGGGVEKLISAFYFSSSDLYFIVKSKMAVILHIDMQNHDVIRNIKYIKAY